MRCGFGALENLKVYSRVCVSNMPAHGCVLTRLKFAARMCVCVCEHVQMQTHCKKKSACVVTGMLFMALAVSWKSIVVSRVSMKSLFIIIIIIIINHPSSGVPGPGNGLNH